MRWRNIRHPREPKPAPKPKPAETRRFNAAAPLPILAIGGGWSSHLTDPYPRQVERRLP